MTEFKPGDWCVLSLHGDAYVSGRVYLAEAEMYILERVSVFSRGTATSLPPEDTLTVRRKTIGHHSRLTLPDVRNSFGWDGPVVGWLFPGQETQIGRAMREASPPVESRTGVMRMTPKEVAEIAHPRRFLDTSLGRLYWGWAEAKATQSCEPREVVCGYLSHPLLALIRQADPGVAGFEGMGQWYESEARAYAALVAGLTRRNIGGTV